MTTDPKPAKACAESERLDDTTAKQRLELIRLLNANATDDVPLVKVDHVRFLLGLLDDCRDALGHAQAVNLHIRARVALKSPHYEETEALKVRLEALLERIGAGGSRG